MSDAIEPPIAFAVPRPGVLTTLGICNIVFSILGFLCIGWSTMMVYVASQTTPPSVEAKVEVSTAPVMPPVPEPTSGPAPSPASAPSPTPTPTPAPTAGSPMVATFNPFMGMQDRSFIRFSMAENGVGLIVDGLMLATGIGLLNRRRWAARGWGYLAWFRIVSVFLLWGYYIVAVAPAYSANLAKMVAGQMTSQGVPAGRIPVDQLTRVYSVMNLIIAVMMMLITSIYPAISIWLLSKPGVKAAIVDKPAQELELP
jgi:hypothetical protein